MHKIKIMFLLCVVLSFVGKNLLAFDDGDFQYWNTESFSVKLADDWKFDAEAEFRFGDDASDFYYQHSDGGITYSGLSKYIDIGLNYRFVFEESGSDWEYINTPHLNLTLKTELEKFKISDRSRFEYRDKENGNDGWRYRNKLTVKFPLKLTDLNIQPYVADEIFVDFDAEDLNRNRLYAGLGFNIYKNLNGDIYYLWQASKSSGKWKDTNVIGTKLKLAF